MTDYRQIAVRGLLIALALISNVSHPPKAGAQTVISPVPANIVSLYHLDTKWYKKYIDVGGLPVLGSANVQDATLIRAADQLETLIHTFPYGPVPSLNSHKIRIVITARNEKMSAIPEVFAQYGTKLDRRYWGGMGATTSLPVSVGTEANIMDNDGRENTFVHETGHTLMELALEEIDPKFTPELDAAWKNAVATGLWTNTYSRTNIKEYWAEGIESYFNVNNPGPVGGNRVHNNIATRTLLANYDPMLYALLNRVFQGATLQNDPFQIQDKYTDINKPIPAR